MTVAVAALAFWLTNVMLREPAEADLHSARPFVHAVESLRKKNPAPLVMVDIGKDSLAIVYHVNVDGEFRPQFIDKVQPLPELKYPVYLLLSERNASAASELANWPAPVLQGFFREGNYRVYYLPSAPP